MELKELRELREGAWEQALQAELERLGRTDADLQTKPQNLPWKIELAATLRKECGASVVWLADQLALGKPSSLRSYLSRLAYNQ